MQRTTCTLATALAAALSPTALAVPLLAFEFNGDNDLEGFVDFADRVTGETTEGGVLKGIIGGDGAPGNGDAQFRTGSDLAPLNLLHEELGTFSVRFRSDSDNDETFDDLTGSTLSGFAFRGSLPYVGASMGNIAGTNVNLGPADSVVDDGDGFVIATWDISGLTATAQEADDPPDVDSIRFDPASGNGAYFEIDYIRIEAAASEIPADLSGDGDVDDEDLGLFFSAFTGPDNGPSPNPAADLSGDGDVDDEDLGQAFSAFTGPLGPASVPEPTSLALLGLGVPALARRRRP